jgi:hypothetical protein
MASLPTRFTKSTRANPDRRGPSRGLISEVRANMSEGGFEPPAPGSLQERKRAPLLYESRALPG